MKFSGEAHHVGAHHGAFVQSVSQCPAPNGDRPQATGALVNIDSHQHFWVYNDRDYVWMTQPFGTLRRDFLPADLKPPLNAIDFDGTIAVQARQMTVETEWLLALADENEFIRGVVGWVDFASEQLDAQLEHFAAHPKLVGVRELIHDMPDVQYALSDVHVHAIIKLARHGLTYDLLLKPQHIQPATALVRRFPEQKFVVDHIAKPSIVEGRMSPWREDLHALAECENVFCKLSGMVTEASWGQWTPDAFQPYLDAVIGAFGPGRCMIGSDWPVCTVSGAYEAVMHIVIDYITALSPDEQRAILGRTCAAFYGVHEKPR